MATNPLSTIGAVGSSGGATNPLATYGASSNNLSVLGQSKETQDLINAAHAHGGAVSQAVDELVQPNTSILSTVGKGFKESFKGFIDLISTPSQIVAGMISKDYTIDEALDMNLRPSDVIFGEQNKDESAMQKVGSFTVRTATDILLDPLTYLTFGASSGSLFGARALSRLTLADDTVASVTRLGQENLNYIRKVGEQERGLASALNAGESTLGKRLGVYKEIKALEASGKIAPEVQAMSKQELQQLMKETLTSPLSPDFAKKALANILKYAPQLGETLIDKGGIKYFGKSILSGQRINSVVKLIPGVTVLDKFTEQGRMAFGALFDPSIQKGSDNLYYRMPPEFMDFQRKTQDMIGYLKEDRIKGLENIIKANKLTANEGKFLTAAIEGGKLPTDARLANAYKQLTGFNDKEIKFLRASGISISRLDNHVPHILVSSENKLLPFKLPPPVKVNAAIGRTMEGTIFKGDAESLTKFERAVLSKDQQAIDDVVAEMKNTGFEIFDDNVLSIHVHRSLDNVRSGSMRQFVENLAQNFAKKASEAPEGYVPINIAKFSNEEEMLIKQGFEENALRFHPAVAKRIEEFTAAVYGDGATKDFLQSFDRLQALWKASVTSIFPAFHGRNAISNVFLNYNDIGLQSLNPFTHAITGQMFDGHFKANDLARKVAGGSEEAAKEYSELLMKPVFKDTSGHEWTFGELRDVMRENSIALRDDVLGQIDVEKTGEEMITGILPGSVVDKLNPFGKSTVTNPFGQNFAPYAWGQKVGNLVEGNARMVNFITNLRNTGDVGLAVARTKQFLFDYKYLTPFEKNVMRRMLPFYSFMRKNMEQQVNTILTAPGRTAAQLTAVNTMSTVLSGASLTDEEKAALPDWMKSGLAIMVKRDGDKVELLNSLGTPVEAMFQQLQPNVVLSAIDPYIRVPVEIASGYSFFNGKAISEVTNAAAFKSAPDFIKDFIGYEEVTFKTKDGSDVTWSVSLNPARMHVLLNQPIVPTSRVLSSIKQIQNEDVSQQYKLLQQTLGIRPYAFNLEVEQQKKEKQLQKDIERILSSAGVGYQFSKFVKKTTVQSEEE